MTEPTRAADRPRAPSEVNAHLGVDLGGTAIKWALLGPDGPLEQDQMPTPRTSTDDVLRALGAVVSDRRSAGIGLAVPGPVGVDDGDELFVPNLRGTFSRSRLRLALGGGGGRIALLNDAHAALLAELRFGGARSARDSALLTLGTGVGGAIALGGELHRGALGRAGEIGHLVVTPQGRRCVCGARGCLETEASASAVLTAARECAAADPSGALGRACEGAPEQLSVEDVVRAARSGDREATRIFTGAGAAIGRAATALAATVAPELLLIGGGLAAAFDLLEQPAAAVLESRRKLMRPARIVPAELGAGAGALGAALWSLEGRGR